MPSMYDMLQYAVENRRLGQTAPHNRAPDPLQQQSGWDTEIPGVARAKEGIDDFLTDKIVDPLASSGYGNLGAGIATAVGMPSEMFASTYGELAMPIKVPSGIRKYVTGLLKGPRKKLTERMKTNEASARAHAKSIAAEVKNYSKAGKEPPRGLVEKYQRAVERERTLQETHKAINHTKDPEFSVWKNQTDAEFADDIMDRRILNKADEVHDAVGSTRAASRDLREDIDISHLPGSARRKIMAEHEALQSKLDESSYKWRDDLAGIASTTAKRMLDRLDNAQARSKFLKENPGSKMKSAPVSPSAYDTLASKPPKLTPYLEGIFKDKSRAAAFRHVSDDVDAAEKRLGGLLDDRDLFLDAGWEIPPKLKSDIKAASLDAQMKYDTYRGLEQAKLGSGRSNEKWMQGTDKDLITDVADDALLANINARKYRLKMQIRESIDNVKAKRELRELEDQERRIRSRKNK